MGRYANYPTTVEDCLYLSMKKLKEWDYFKYVGIKSGVISWSRNGVKHSSVSISVNNVGFDKFLILDYKSNGEPKNYTVKIIRKPSNLGKGEVLYFVCPSTGKHCTKLILRNGYFLHREAHRGLMYAKQIESKSFRSLSKVLEQIHLSDEVYEERYKKYFKTHYNGKPTKRFLKLQSKIDCSESFPYDTIEKILIR